MQGLSIWWCALQFFVKVQVQYAQYVPVCPKKLWVRHWRGWYLFFVVKCHTFITCVNSGSAECNRFVIWFQGFTGLLLRDCWAHEVQIPRNTLCFFVCLSVRFTPESLIEIFWFLFVFPYVKLFGISYQSNPFNYENWFWNKNFLERCLFCSQFVASR